MRIFICNHDERGVVSRLVRYLTTLDHIVHTNEKPYRTENSKYAAEELRNADVVIGIFTRQGGLSHPFWEWAELNQRPLLFVKAGHVEYISHRYVSVYTFDCSANEELGFAALAEHLKRPITSQMEVRAFTYRHPLAPDAL